MKTSVPWLSADIQARTKPLLTPLIKAYLEEQKASNIIKVKIRRNLSQVTSETYKVNIYTFDDVQLEEFLMLLRNWKIATDITGTNSPSVWINDLCTLLCGSSLIEFDELTLQGNTTNNHLNIINKGLPE